MCPANQWFIPRFDNGHNPWDIVGIDHPDARFIVHSRKDVPDLVAEVERLQHLLEHAGEFLPTLLDLAEESHEASTYPDPHEASHNIGMIHSAQIWCHHMSTEQDGQT